ncbi:MAG: V-type ATP synthase subunit I [Spirochaetota bacterium]
MIETMKSMSIFVKESDRGNSLRELRKLGLMHLKLESVSSERAEELQQQYDDISRVIHRIEETYGESVKNSRHIIEEQIRVDEVLHKLSKLTEKIYQEQELKAYIAECTREIERLSPWGDFSPAKVHRLRRDGIHVYLYEVGPSLLKKDALHDYTYVIINREKKVARIAVFGHKLADIPETSLFELPEKGLLELTEEIKESRNQLQHIHEYFKDESRFILSYKDVQKMILEQLRFELVHEGMEGNGNIAWITGFVPADSLDAITSHAKNQQWGYLIDEVSPDDTTVPTKLKHNAFVRLIQPVFDLLGTVPGYREYDVSLFFLLFFSVFFAMIIGDAGYGLIFLAASVIIHITIRKPTSAVRLMYLLSGTTIAWGAASGNWFGSEAVLQSLPFLQQLTLPQIASFPELFDVTSKETQNTVMYICFVLAILQLGLACLINFFRAMPSLKAFSNLGWLALLVGLYQVVLNLVIGLELASWTVPVVAAGFIVFVLFHEQRPGSSFFKGLLRGIGGLFNTFLDSISAFSNIISYIRLFAVGMASLAIASSFNNMAQPMLGGWTIPAAIFILLIGHGLNLAMGLLSVVVHGVRLNMLEFSGQLGMEWTGIKYEPFKEHLDSSLQDELQTTQGEE